MEPLAVAVRPATAEETFDSLQVNTSNIQYWFGSAAVQPVMSSDYSRMTCDRGRSVAKYPLLHGPIPCPS